MNTQEKLSQAFIGAVLSHDDFGIELISNRLKENPESISDFLLDIKKYILHKRTMINIPKRENNRHSDLSPDVYKNNYSGYM